MLRGQGRSVRQLLPISEAVVAASQGLEAISLLVSNLITRSTTSCHLQPVAYYNQYTCSHRIVLAEVPFLVDLWRLSATRTANECDFKYLISFMPQLKLRLGGR